MFVLCVKNSPNKYVSDLTEEGVLVMTERVEGYRLSSGVYLGALKFPSEYSAHAFINGYYDGPVPKGSKHSELEAVPYVSLK